MYEGEGVENPRVWCFTAGPPEPDTLARFSLLTKMGQTAWIIIPVPVDEFEFVPEGPEYSAV